MRSQVTSTTTSSSTNAKRSVTQLRTARLRATSRPPTGSTTTRAPRSPATIDGRSSNDPLSTTRSSTRASSAVNSTARCTASRHRASCAGRFRVQMATVMLAGPSASGGSGSPLRLVNSGTRSPTAGSRTSAEPTGTPRSRATTSAGAARRAASVTLCDARDVAVDDRHPSTPTGHHQILRRSVDAGRPIERPSQPRPESREEVGDLLQAARAKPLQPTRQRLEKAPDDHLMDEDRDDPRVQPS